MGASQQLFSRDGLYSAAMVRELDRVVIAEHGIAGIELMERAGAAAWRALRQRWPRARGVLLLCGSGNNGGDGFVMARLAATAGLQTQVVLVGREEAIKGEALTAYQRMRSHALPGLVVTPWAQAKPTLTADLAEADVVVDAMLGTGTDRAVTGHWAEAVEQVGQSSTPVLAMDVPTGIHGDTGVTLGVGIRATCTVSFIGRKRGLATGAGRAAAGELVFDDLEVPDSAYPTAVDAYRFPVDAAVPYLSPRARHAHKGHFGHVLVVGGDEGYGGAVRLAGEAAARGGAGLVSVASHPSHVNAILAARPEIMAVGVLDPVKLEPLLERATVIALGPGLGLSPWSERLWAAGVASPKPLVLDADGLNWLSRAGSRLSTRRDWVLTPHPGEAARLLHCETAEIEADRYHAVSELAERFKAVVILKGAGSLVCAPGGPVYVVEAGNPGMASGGMGDLLTGLIAALWAQGLSALDAARVGAVLHATAADEAVIGADPTAPRERGLLASDLLEPLRKLLNPPPKSG